jgi:hypothetical protein
MPVRSLADKRVATPEARRTAGGGLSTTVRRRAAHRIAAEQVDALAEAGLI